MFIRENPNFKRKMFQIYNLTNKTEILLIYVGISVQLLQTLKMGKLKRKMFIIENMKIKTKTVSNLQFDN